MAVTQAKLKIYSANSGNGAAGNFAVDTMIAPLFASDEGVDLIAVGFQETNFVQAARELYLRVCRKWVEDNFIKHFNSSEEDIDNTRAYKLLVEFLDITPKSARLAAVDDYTAKLKKLKLAPVNDFTLSSFVGSYEENAPKVLLSTDNMPTVTKPGLIGRFFTNKVLDTTSFQDDHYKGISETLSGAGLCQIIVHNSTVNVELSALDEAKSTSPRAIRRSGSCFIPTSSADNKGWKRQRLKVTRSENKNDDGVIIELETGHCESAGPAKGGSAKRVYDIINGCIPAQTVVVNSDEDEIDNSYNAITRQVGFDLKASCSDANTRNFLSDPRFTYENGAFVFSDGEGEGYDCWESKQGRKQPEMHAFLQASSATHMWGGKNTYLEKSKSISTVDAKRQRRGSGNLDRVHVTKQYGQEGVSSNSEGNQIDLLPGEKTKRDHAVVKSGVIECESHDEFTRVKNQMACALQNSAPQLAAYVNSLNDDDSGKKVLVDVYKQYLDRDGLLHQRLQMYAEKLAAVDRLRAAWFKAFEREAKQCVVKPSLDSFGTFGAAGTDYMVPPSIVVDPVRCDEGALSGVNKRYKDAWIALNSFEQEALFSEYTDGAWFGGDKQINDDAAFEQKKLRDKAKLVIDQEKMDILLRLLSSPENLIARGGVANLRMEPPETKEQLVYSHTQSLYRETQDFINGADNQVDDKCNAIKKVWKDFNLSIKSATSIDEVSAAYHLCQQAIVDLQKFDDGDVSDLLKNLTTLLNYNHRIAKGLQQYSINSSSNKVLATHLLGSMYKSFATDSNKDLAARIEGLYVALNDKYYSSFSEEKEYAKLWQPVQERFQQQQLTRLQGATNNHQAQQGLIARVKQAIHQSYSDHIKNAKCDQELKDAGNIYQQALTDAGKIGQNKNGDSNPYNTLVDNARNLFEFNHLIHQGKRIHAGKQPDLQSINQDLPDQSKVIASEDKDDGEIAPPEATLSGVLDSLRVAVAPPSGGDQEVKQSMALSQRIVNLKVKCSESMRVLEKSASTISLWRKIKKFFGFTSIEDEAYELASTTDSPQQQ